MTMDGTKLQLLSAILRLLAKHEDLTYARIMYQTRCMRKRFKLNNSVCWQYMLEFCELGHIRQEIRKGRIHFVNGLAVDNESSLNKATLSTEERIKIDPEFARTVEGIRLRAIAYERSKIGKTKTTSSEISQEGAGLFSKQEIKKEINEFTKGLRDHARSLNKEETPPPPNTADGFK